MIFHPVVVNITLVAAAGVVAAPRVCSWTWLIKLFRKAEKPAEPWSLVASIRRVFPNGVRLNLVCRGKKGACRRHKPMLLRLLVNQ